MNLDLHNLIVTVGPSMCGKSTWSKQLKTKLNEKYPRLNVKHISSDSLRKFLQDNDDLDRYDDDMWYASDGAFKLLNTMVSTSMAWPIVAEIIIVDTTALSKRFREEMVELAKANAYKTTVAVFNYRNRDDYFKFTDSNNHITQKHLNKMKYVWKDLSIFDNRLDINSFDPPDVHVDDYEYYLSHFIQDNDYIVVGDVHGQYEALCELPDNRRRIYVGDIVDKASIEDVERTIDYVYDDVNSGNALFVIGNHDHWCVNFWAGKDGYTKDIAEMYFNSALELSEPHREKLESLVKNGRYFYRTPKAIITHAPCKHKYLGKLHTWKKQNTMRYPKVADYENRYEWQNAIYNKFSFLTEEPSMVPIHVWGHISLTKPFRYGANVGIDVGSYLGNGLCYFDLIENRYSFIKSKLTSDGVLVDSLIKAEPKLKLEDLDSREKGRILWTAHNRVNFISGTMTPADKMNGILESFEWGFKYFQERYGRVVIQPKYMGSRGQVYLFNNPEESYSVSRNGYIYKDNELLYPEYERLIKRFSPWDNDVRLIILDCEILPWRLLGENLIDKEFYAYGEISLFQAMNSEIMGLDKWSPYFRNLKVIRNGEEVGIDRATKQEVIKQHGHHIWSTYLAYKNLVKPRVDDIKEFLRQVDIYGKDSQPTIKPFSILKEVRSSGDSLFINYDHSIMWNLINDDKMLVTDNMFEGFEFYESLSKNDYEGVVLKPPKQVVDGNLPYVKVRNPEYLRIVYGPSYMETIAYNKLMERKSITNKIKASLNEWLSGWQMLRVPYSELVEENEELIQLYINHIYEDYGAMDPRL